MTWGVQNTCDDAHEQLDYAVKERGVNFIDTAEAYPVPLDAPNYVAGTTESYIGAWLATNPEWRSRVVIATKVSSEPAVSRSTPPKYGRLTSERIQRACEGSLRRLQTDYIDLYQLHWPDRYVPIKGHREYENIEIEHIGFRDTLLGIRELLRAGKIRHWGVCNETTFGICELVRTADELGMARPVSVQNQFCLLNRAFESHMAEACAPNNYNIALLPWSVLGGGVLSGKYTRDKEGTLRSKEIESRFMEFDGYQKRFTTKENFEVIKQYENLARNHNIPLAQLALQFCKSRWYIPSTIIGATNMRQLKMNIDALDNVALMGRTKAIGEEILRDIDAIHVERMDPFLRL